MWCKPPQKLTLTNNQIDIWYLNIDDYRHRTEALKQLLSEDEKQRAQRYRTPTLQNNFIINRAILRLLLSRYTQINPQQMAFAYSQKGKPCLINNSSKVNFNLSHKNNDTIYGFSRLNLGVDIEIVNEKVKVLEIAQRFYTEAEYKHMTKLTQPEQSTYFFELWTAKESYLKAIAEGLSGGLDSINLSKQKNQRGWQIELVDQSSAESCLWQIQTINFEQDYFLSWAVKDQGDLVVNYYQLATNYFD